MKFEQYQQIKAHALAACTAAGLTYGEPKQLNPILLAYIGDVVFSLYVRLRLLPTSGQVRVIHDLGSKMVSAVMQAKAMEALLSDLTEEEAYIARRGGDNGIRTASCNCEGTEQLQRRNNSLRGWGQYGKITMKCTDIADAIRKILKSIMQRGI